MKAAPQPSLFQRMGKPCLAGCLTVGVHRTLPLNPPPRSNTAIVSERSSSPHLATLFSSDPFQAHCWIGKCLHGVFAHRAL